jgi:hypothetical protein
MIIRKQTWKFIIEDVMLNKRSWAVMGMGDLFRLRTQKWYQLYAKSSQTWLDSSGCTRPF